MVFKSQRFFTYSNEIDHNILQKERRQNPNNYYRNQVTLKKQVKKNDYAEKQNIIEVEETATKKILHQRKFEKFSILENKPKPIVKTTNFTEGKEYLEKSPATEKSTNVEILKATKNPSKRTSKTNLNNYKTNKNINKKLPSLSPSI